MYIYFIFERNTIILKFIKIISISSIFKIHTSFEGVRKTITEVDNKVQSVNTTIKQMETSVDSSIQDVGTSVKSIDETMNKMVHEIRKSNEESTQRINSSFEVLFQFLTLR